MSNLHSTLKNPKPLLCFIVKETNPEDSIIQFKKVMNDESLLVLDQKLQFYKYLGANKTGYFGLLSASMVSIYKAFGKELADSNTGAVGNGKGDWMLMGGYLVMNSQGKEVDRFTAKSLSDVPNFDKLKLICEKLIVE